MKLKLLNNQVFEEFASKNAIGNYYQSTNYINFLKSQKLDYEILGLFDEYGKLQAASLIIIKTLTKSYKYGYAPKGFILDYFNKELLQEFTAKIIEHYQKKKVIFIKINPEIAVAEINSKTFEKTYNQNIEIKNYLIDLGYTKLKDNLYFESKQPKYNGIINLKKFNLEKVNKNTRNKIGRATTKGLKFEIKNKNEIDILYSFIKKKKQKEIEYYKNYYTAFSKNKNIDLFLVSIDTNKYLENAKNAYEKELIANAKITSTLEKSQTEKKLNSKMNSDKKLLVYKNDILDAQNKVKKKETIYIAGALVIKYKNRISILISGYDKNYKRFNPNYYLHYQILEYYKKEYDFADLNGLTGDFTKENPYKGLNEFKLGFKPKIYEFIGEYDLVIQEKIYKKLLTNGKLAKILNKKDIKN